jgi:RimJ/RimL family protein N-acetyltransferase
VTLRAWRPEDAAFMVGAFGDPAIRRYNGRLDADGYPGLPLSLADATRDIATFASSWRTFASTGRPTGAVFAITDAQSGELAGCCGVDDWSTERVAQIGYWLAPEGRGRGFATRAAILLTAWLFELGAARVFLTVVAGNEPSMAVARRAGFAHEATLPSHSAWMGERFDVLRFERRPPTEANRARR